MESIVRKKVRDKRLLSDNEDESEQEMFNIGDDENFEGLHLEKEVGEDAMLVVWTG